MHVSIDKMMGVFHYKKKWCPAFAFSQFSPINIGVFRDLCET